MSGETFHRVLQLESFALEISYIIRDPNLGRNPGVENRDSGVDKRFLRRTE